MIRVLLLPHEVYFSLYQQLVGDDDKEHFSELFTPDFFDLIIVDGVSSWLCERRKPMAQNFGIFQLWDPDRYDCNAERNQVYFQPELFLVSLSICIA